MLNYGDGFAFSFCNKLSLKFSAIPEELNNNILRLFLSTIPMKKQNTINKTTLDSKKNNSKWIQMLCSSHYRKCKYLMYCNLNIDEQSKV